MAVRFPLLTPEQVPHVLAMMARLYQHDAVPFDAENAARAVTRLIAEPHHGACWLIEADGSVAGYFVVTIGYSLEFHGRYGLLDEFFVAEEFRSRGIGGEALAFIFEWCRGQSLDAVRLEAAHDNPRAIALYRRCGFEIHDRHLMTRWL